MAREYRREPEALDRLRRLPFVRRIEYTRAIEGRESGYDGRLEITTTQGKFQLAVEVKRSHVSRSVVDQLIAWMRHLRAGKAQGVILLARHIPRQAAEALIEANVNFADDVGNVHLNLGDTYSWTWNGEPAPEPPSERRPASPSQLQSFFQFVTHPESINSPVRQLESTAGVSKSSAAQARLQMIGEGLLTRTGKQYKLGPASLLADRLVSGYAQVLRPKLKVGTFRHTDKTAEAFLSRLRKDVPPAIRYSLTGGLAAELLQHFYYGPEVTLFLEPSISVVTPYLRLFPDRKGPVTILKAFGDLVFWEKRENLMLAPPWLIYAELLSSKDPRAHEAARELRRELLNTDAHR